MTTTDDIITATSELSVTDGNGGSAFADIIPAANKAFFMGKLGVGTFNPVNALDVEGGTALGAAYSGNFEAPANGLIVEGNVGIGTAAPGAKLEVAGALRVSQDASLALSGGNVGIGTATPAAKLEVAGALRVSQDASLAVSGGNVGIGTISPLAKLQIVGGALMPSAGNAADNGILFPQNPGGGAGDNAWMRYYTRTGEGCTLEIGVSNDPDDHIALMSSGNVGIGTAAPKNKLDVAGDIAIQGKHAFRGSDAWLRLNQDLAFTAGIYTPGNLVPMSLNVGGAAGYGNPGTGNALIAGALTVNANANALHFTSGWTGYPDYYSGHAEISNDVGGYKTLMIVGNNTAGLGRRVSIWDRLEVNGESFVTGNMTVGPYLIANGAGGERAYIGGDGWGNDVQIGSFNAGVTGIGFWNATAGTRMTLYAQDYIRMSDARLKTNVEPLSGALDKVLKLRGVKFDWAEGSAEGKSEAKAAGKAVEKKSDRKVGLIAQEVLEIVPEAVTKDNRGMYGISHAPLLSLLIEAIKEQNARLERLERQLAAPAQPARKG